MRFSAFVFAVWMGCLAADAAAQTPLTWNEVRARFEANNPDLRAGQIGIDESKADEMSAYLRPNPQLGVAADGINFLAQPDGAGRLDGLSRVVSFSYLRERGGKRELRGDSARHATAIAVSTEADLARNLTFSLRGAFVQLLQAKAFLTLAQAELTDYDQVLALSRDRFQAGDLAQVDLDRLELQRVQYESDVQTATVNVRTAKIELVRLMHDTTPVEQFDVTGPYDFVAPAQPLDYFRQMALQARPDLQAAVQTIDKARIDHQLAVANGALDLTIGTDIGLPKSSGNYFGANLSVPIQLFDRNQGEKRKTELEVTRDQRLADSARAQVLADVDSAYATVQSTVALLQPYRATYLTQATRVRDTINFSYQSGAASLLDFLQTQQDYRAVQISYVNLVASFLTAVSQLNFAVGQEVIP